MSLLDFIFCSGCRTAPKRDITADIDLLSLEILLASRDAITILLETKVSLNCSNFHPSDCLYVLANPKKSPITCNSISNKEFSPQNKIRLDLEGGYTVLNKAELKIKPGIYNLLYLRYNGSSDNDEEVSDWKVLGTSAAFQLDLVEEKPKKYNQKSQENSIRSTKYSEKENKNRKNGSKEDIVESPSNFDRLKTDIFGGNCLDETFLPLNPQKLNLDTYFTNPSISKYKKKRENKENDDPNVFS